MIKYSDLNNIEIGNESIKRDVVNLNNNEEDKFKVINLTILSYDFLKDIFIPNFDLVTFLSKKGKDYQY